MSPNNPPFPISPRVSSLFSSARLEALAALQQRSVSTASRISQMSQASQDSMVSEFLEAQITALEDQKAYILSLHDGLAEAQSLGKLSDQGVSDEIQPYITKMRTTSNTLNILKRQKKVLTEDLSEEIASRRPRASNSGEETAKKRPRTSSPPDEGLLERAYQDTIVPRVMGAAAKIPKSLVNQRKFKADLEEYYGIRNLCTKGTSWCHVLGLRLPARSVKAAHLVPKSLSDDEVTHLFGGEHKVQSDPRNGLTLSTELELLLDQGAFVIVPIPGELTTPTTWRCVVLNDAKRDEHICTTKSGDISTLGDLDGQELKFLTDNRPRRRYLYFRFIISYLNAKKLGQANTTAKIESRRFWPSGGEYLHRSTLRTLARCVSGSDIPEQVLEGNTFDGPEETTLDSEMGMVISAAISTNQADHSQSPAVREALLASLANLTTED